MKYTKMKGRNKSKYKRNTHQYEMKNKKNKHT